MGEQAELQNKPGVAIASREALAVQKLEQRDRVLTRDSGPILELRDPEAGTFPIR